MITAPTEFSGLQVWLDASDTTSLFQLSGGTTAVAANLDPVGYWGDKSGNARHFTNIGGSATTRPTWVSSLSTVRFDGSNDFLSSIFSVNFANQSVFLVTSFKSYAASGRVYAQVNAAGIQDTGGSNFMPLIQNGAAGALATQIDSAGTRSSISTRSLSSYDVISHVRSGGTLQNFVDGSGASTYTSANTTYTSYASRLGMGFTSGFGSTYLPSNVDISEVIVYNRALTNNERADVEYYLTRKWNFLNSIPRQTYAIKNGLWSDSATWSISAEPSPWNFPLSADNAYTNTFTVTADSSTKVDTIRNSTLAPNILSGGSFVLANGVSLSANVAGGAPAPNFTLQVLPNSTGTIVGNLSGGSRGALQFSYYNAAGISSNSNLNIYGSMFGTLGNNYGLSANTSGTINVYGNIHGESISTVGNGSENNWGFVNVGVGITNIYGNLYGYVRSGSVLQTGSGTVNVFGDVYGGAGNIVSFARSVGVYSVNGTTNIYGKVYANAQSAGGYSLGVYTDSANAMINLSGDLIATNVSEAIRTTVTTPLSVYGNIINAPNGRQAIYAPRYQVFPSASATYTRQAVNGYDSYTDYWTSDATFTYPASSDVVLSTVYNNNTLSGSMALPPTSAVALGASVGTTSGTASITLEGLLNQPVATLNTPNSIGARLKNIATTQALSAVANSLDFNN
jgi:hypothetical protein